MLGACSAHARTHVIAIVRCWWIQQKIIECLGKLLIILEYYVIFQNLMKYKIPRNKMGFRMLGACSAHARTHVISIVRCWWILQKIFEY